MKFKSIRVFPRVGHTGHGDCRAISVTRRWLIPVKIVHFEAAIDQHRGIVQGCMRMMQEVVVVVITVVGQATVMVQTAIAVCADTTITQRCEG